MNREDQMWAEFYEHTKLIENELDIGVLAAGFMIKKISDLNKRIESLENKASEYCDTAHK